MGCFAHLGVVRFRRKSGGPGLIIVGGIWGLLAVVSIGVTAYGVYDTFYKDREPGVQVFVPEKSKNPLGSILLDYKGDFSIVVKPLGQKQYLEISGTNGKALVPSGILKIKEVTITAKDYNGHTWKASYSGDREEMPEVFVPAGGLASLDIGPPFIAVPTVEHISQLDAAFGLRFKDMKGRRCDIELVEFPTRWNIRVLSESGKVLWDVPLHLG